MIITRERWGHCAGVGYNPPMPSYPYIDQYRSRLKELIEFGGSDNEENIRPAFQNCLDSYCRDHREKLVLVPELKTSLSNKPDGTVKDSLRMARGYWEAKGSHDDLDVVDWDHDCGYCPSGPATGGSCIGSEGWDARV